MCDVPSACVFCYYVPGIILTKHARDVLHVRGRFLHVFSFLGTRTCNTKKHTQAPTCLFCLLRTRYEADRFYVVQTTLLYMSAFISHSFA